MDLAAERAYPTPFANSQLFPLLLLSLATQRQAPKTADSFREEYDYVIVGAGSAGSVVARRLSEIPCVTVLLLEAGKGALPVVSDVPAVARSFVGSDLDWKYKTTPQENTAAALVNRQVVWPSGKALGGSSVINAMLNVRGNRMNYDTWERLGATGWRYEDVLKYFKKVEDNQEPDQIKSGFHGIGGPVTVMRPRYNSEIKDPLAAAATELGYRFADSNGYFQSGFFNHTGTLRNGQRCSAAKAYLVPAENRTNLDILPNAMVRKVVIQSSSQGIPGMSSQPRATGVLFDYEGSTHEVRARREVILSAGAINTAQLLMLSGVGPRRELNKFQIPVVAELPVGMNLQDHVGAFLAYTIDDSIPKFTEKLGDDRNVQEYIDNRTGPLTSTEGVTFLSFLSNSPVEITDAPNHQLYFVEGFPELLVAQIGLKPDVYEKVYGPYVNSTFYWCVSSNLQSRSKGCVRLQSADPYDPPLINPNYFQNRMDLLDIVQGMKTCNRIAETQAMKSVSAKAFETVFPGCETEKVNEEAYLACQAKSLVLTFNHQVGTAKMGNAMDRTTVVDPQLRVKGINGLRVVDASIIPTIPWGNTNTPTMMVAEKASDIIKGNIRCDVHNTVHDASSRAPTDPSSRATRGV